MDIDLKLKNGFLKKITSYLDTDTIYDYYGDYQKPMHDITFEFHTTENSGIKYRFYIDEDYGDFCYLASFFYQKDFSEFTVDEFLRQFSEYVHTEPKCATY